MKEPIFDSLTLIQKAAFIRVKMEEYAFQMRNRLFSSVKIVHFNHFTHNLINLEGLELNLSRITLTFGGSFSGINFSKFNFAMSHMWSEFDDCNFSDSNLSGIDTGGGSFKNANFTRANFTDGSLIEVQMNNACLKSANLTRAILCGADLDGVCLDEAILTDAIIINVKNLPISIEEAKIRGAICSTKDLILYLNKMASFNQIYSTKQIENCNNLLISYFAVTIDNLKILPRFTLKEEESTQLKNLLKILYEKYPNILVKDKVISLRNYVGNPFGSQDNIKEAFSCFLRKEKIKESPFLNSFPLELISLIDSYLINDIGEDLKDSIAAKKTKYLLTDYQREILSKLSPIMMQNIIDSPLHEMRWLRLMFTTKFELAIPMDEIRPHLIEELKDSKESKLPKENTLDVSAKPPITLLSPAIAASSSSSSSSSSLRTGNSITGENSVAATDSLNYSCTAGMTSLNPLHHKLSAVGGSSSIPSDNTPYWREIVRKRCREEVKETEDNIHKRQNGASNCR